MESMDLQGGHQSKGAVTLVVCPVKAFEKSETKCGLAWSDLFGVSAKGFPWHSADTLRTR